MSDAARILSILSSVVSIGIFMPFEIRWFVVFWKQRRNPFISKRRPTMLLILLLTLSTWTLCIMSLSVVDAFKDEFKQPIWDSIIIILYVISGLFWTIFLGLSMARLWLLHWEINSTAALKNNQWKSIINDQQWRDDWYLKHQRDYGNQRWIKRRLVLYALSAFIALEATNFVPVYQPEWPKSAGLSVTFWTLSLFHWTYFDFMPLFTFYFVMKYIVSTDAIGLKKELNTVTIYFAVMATVTTIYNITPFFPDLITKYWPIIWRIYILLLRILLFLMLYMNTRWVVRKFGFLIHHKEDNGSSDPRAINLTSRRMRRFAHQSTIESRFCLIEEESVFSLTVDDQEMMLNMRRVLMLNAMFEAFMNYLFDEYAHEYLLSIIEMIQFKKRIYDEKLTNEQRKSVMSSQSSWRIGDHLLKIPAECPQSAIVYGLNNNFKRMAKQLYFKYVAENSDYEINVDWTTRKDLEDLIDNEWWEFDDDENDFIHLYTLFDASLIELHSLITPVFDRFQQSDSYKLIDIQSRPILSEEYDEDDHKYCSSGIFALSRS